MSSSTMSHSVDTAWLVFTIPAVLTTNNMLNGFVLLCILVSTLFIGLVSWVRTAGGLAWRNGRNHLGKVPIPGPRGLPFFGSLFSLSHGLAHRTLASMVDAGSGASTQLMAFSLGSTPVVVASEPQTAREILTSPHFADRPLKQSAKSLMFGRAIGFAPNGTYWRLLRRISSTHLFSPRRISAHEPGRQLDCAVMLDAISKEQSIHGIVVLRKHIQAASLNNIMGTVFGKRYDFALFDNEVEQLREIINEGFELLGAFNWSDHLPWLKYFCDPHNINNRCATLVPRVAKFVKSIIEEHQLKWLSSSKSNPDISDFVDVLLSLDGEEKLSIDDMVAVLWEMIFRGTDTAALLTEWAMAELVLNPSAQTKLRRELTSVIGAGPITDAVVAKLPYLEAVVKETLRLHPPGPLLSWARLSTSDVQLSNGMVVPAKTTAMVNMWAITHDPNLWDDPLAFRPERFLANSGGIDIDVRGIDLRLAPFGAGRRSCPGKNLGLTTVSLWVAKLVHHFEWVHDEARPIDLTEELKLSCEMKTPFTARAVPIKSNA